MTAKGVIAGSAQTLVTVSERAPPATARLADLVPRHGWSAYNQDITGSELAVVLRSWFGRITLPCRAAVDGQAGCRRLPSFY